MENEYLYKELKRTLSNLSADLDAQEVYLKSIGTYPSLDELALEFDDIFRYAIGQLNIIKFSEEQIEILRKIDFELSLISGEEHAKEWQIGTQNLQTWHNIRSLAKNALILFGF